VRGGDYGYRFRLGRKGLHPFSSWNGELAGTLPMTSGTGEAPSGILVCEHESLPAEYHGALLVTSWGDYRLEVHRLRPHGASFRSDPKVLVRGGEAFRPVGIAAGPDGAVYFTDWVDRDYHVHRKGRVWRLRAKGPAAAPLDLSGGYSAPSADTGGFAGEAERWRRGRARHRQLVTAATAGRLGLEAIEHIGDAELRAAAVRLLANESAPSPQAVEVITRLACEDPSPRVRLEALLGVRGPPAIEKLAATFHAEEDPFLQAAALDAAARLSTKASIQALASSPEPRVRLFALLVLRRNGGVGREVAPFAAAGERLAPDAAAPFLRDRDPDVRRAALQWVGEERLVELSEAVDEALCAGPIDRALLDAYLAALGMLRGERPEGRDARSRDEFLHDLACEKGRPAALRALALRSVSTSFRGWKLERLRDLLSEADLDLRREALRSLSQTGLGGARGLLVEVARRPAEDRRLRREAVASLAAFVADRSDDLAAPLAALLEDADASVRREAARSLRGVPLAEDLDARRARIEAEVRERGPSAALPSGSSGWREGLLSGGDPLEGELVFFHPRGPRCSSCHTVRGRGGLAGPDLSAAGAATRERLLDSLLVPSKEIAPRFVTRTVVTATGIHTGVLLGEDPEGRILLANAQGEVLSIPRRDAVEVREEAASLMPENLAAQLEYGELRDLLSYLESLK
jgi:putative heme-binding domain-containing protein